ncbi:MAG: T9SS type A sorting domain-containing protein [Bacteroidota bacterium]
MLKKILLFIAILYITNGLIAQSTIITDTLEFSHAKTTSAQIVTNYSSSFSINAWAQYFDAPVEITISGFNFYAVSDTTAPVDVIAEIYLVNTDSMITGSALASTTITLDTNHYGINTTAWTGGTISEIEPFKKTALFSPPVTVDQPFVILVKNPTDSVTLLFTNNYNYPYLDGNGEYLANMLWNGTWFRSNDPALGLLFNADLLYEPFVEYDADVDIIMSPECLSNDWETVDFSIADTSVYCNRMYSSAKYNCTQESQFYWTFEGLPPTTVFAINPSIQYMIAAEYTIFLDATLQGWNNNYTISDFTVDTLEMCSTGVNNINESNSIIDIYPNPSEGIFYVSGISGADIQIYSIAGEEIININNCNLCEHIDLSGLNSSMYFIKITKDNKVNTKIINIITTDK